MVRCLLALERSCAFLNPSQAIALHANRIYCLSLRASARWTLQAESEKADTSLSFFHRSRSQVVVEAMIALTERDASRRSLPSLVKHLMLLLRDPKRGSTAFLSAAYQHLSKALKDGLANGSLVKVCAVQDLNLWAACM